MLFEIDFLSLGIWFGCCFCYGLDLIGCLAHFIAKIGMYLFFSHYTVLHRLGWILLANTPINTIARFGCVIARINAYLAMIITIKKPTLFLRLAWVLGCHFYTC